MRSDGINPLKDFILLLKLWQILRKETPDVYLGYTVKPNVYGSLAAKALGIGVINNIAGLGSVFIRAGFLAKLVCLLYKIALWRSQTIFFQNPDDKALFIKLGLVNPQICDLLPGSGIDLQKFQPVPLPQNKRFRFLMIGRMLRDKGVFEFVEAARIVKPLYPNAEFCLLGFLDVQNPTAITAQQMENWVNEGLVNYLGTSEDVRPEIAEADCVVLPSYREGTPRTLLEAAAMARPIITTDAVGCREVVENGKNGLLCRIKDTSDLSKKMQCMIKMPRAERIQMGLSGRLKVENEFSESFVIEKYLERINAMKTSLRIYY